jgi:hypothetical protein
MFILKIYDYEFRSFHSSLLTRMSEFHLRRINVHTTLIDVSTLTTPSHQRENKLQGITTSYASFFLKRLSSTLLKPAETKFGFLTYVPAKNGLYIILQSLDLLLTPRWFTSIFIPHHLRWLSQHIARSANIVLHLPCT